MKTFPVGEFKAHFAEIMKQVRAGEEIIIRYDKKKRMLEIGDQLPRRRGIKDAVENVGALFRRGPAWLGEIFQHHRQQFRVDYPSIEDRMARRQFCTRFPAPHLIEEKVAQAVGDEARAADIIGAVRLLRLGHVTLHAGDDVRARLAQRAEIGNLRGDGVRFIGFGVL